MLVAAGIAVLLFNYDLALDVEEAYATVCAAHTCPSIAREIDMLKLCAVVTAVAVPAALAWAIDRRRNG
jgi:choline-glycine betaine transporter